MSTTPLTELIALRGQVRVRREEIIEHATERAVEEIANEEDVSELDLEQFVIKHGLEGVTIDV